MRASLNGKHISGAESIVDFENIDKIVSEYTKRALNHEKGIPDFINIKVERISENIKYVPHLPIKTINCRDIFESRKIAKNILEKVGIPEKTIKKSFNIIDKGGMRGAAILDLNGNRLEPDKKRGVRVKNISSDINLKNYILSNKLGTERTVEAIAIATKAIDLGIMAEICISDNPSYTTGYVSTKKGYFRITNLKKYGVGGGRVFFVKDSENIENIIKDLENKPYIIY